MSARPIRFRARRLAVAVSILSAAAVVAAATPLLAREPGRTEICHDFESGRQCVSFAADCAGPVRVRAQPSGARECTPPVQEQACAGVLGEIARTAALARTHPHLEPPAIAGARCRGNLFASDKLTVFGCFDAHPDAASLLLKAFRLADSICH